MKFRDFLIESAASDQYEKDVAEYLDSFDNVSAIRPRVSPKYSDIVVEYNGVKSWLEVKMNHSDNLGNPRVSYVDGNWIAAAPINAIKEFAINYLKKSSEVKKFLKEISTFSGISLKDISIPSTKGGLKKDGAVSRDTMAEFLKSRTQYILDIKNVDLGKLVTTHYLEGKAEPAHYMQAGDDFYLIGNENPLGLDPSIPKLEGIGSFKMRIGVRTSFYEVQPEIKITKMPSSKYSIKPGTKKINPFLR